MSEIRDRRRRADLDLFVLALIDSGVSTPYELQKMAGLSPGATIPALDRLLEKGFLRRGEPGAHRRTNNRITSTGKKHLKTDWRALLENGPSGDLDADLRIALLTLWGGGERHLAVEFLRQSAVKKAESMDWTAEDNMLNSSATLAAWYSRLRSSAAKARLKGESAAVLSIAETLPRHLLSKRKRSDSTAQQKRP